MGHSNQLVDPYATIQRVKGAGMRVGLAIKPATPIDDRVLSLLREIDLLLVMTVEPGFGGQALIPACLQKVHQARQHVPHLDIQVDGGINLENLSNVINAGANVIVAGTLIFNSPDAHKMIKDMREIMNGEGKSN